MDDSLGFFPNYGEHKRLIRSCIFPIERFKRIIALEESIDVENTLEMMLTKRDTESNI